MINFSVPKKLSLFVFSIFVGLLTYGYALTNFSLTIDNEQSFSYNDMVSMDLGRWGTNLITCKLFEGIYPYFSLLFSIIVLSFSAYQMCKLFKFNGILGYLFCGLFITFPQMAYQFIFLMQSAAVAIGFLCSVLAVQLFNDFTVNRNIIGYIKLFVAVILLLFVIAIYQALIFIPIILFVICFYQNTFSNDFNFKAEIKKTIFFILVILAAVGLYIISINTIFPNTSGNNTSFMTSYTSGQTNNRFVSFYNLWIDNLRGNYYYGDKTFVVASLLTLVLIVKLATKKINFIYKLLALFLLLLLPFIISYFITSGGSPPRLYITSGLVFAFIVVEVFKQFKYKKQLFYLSIILCLINMFYISNLYISQHKIFNHDVCLAKKMDAKIYEQYPDFNPSSNYVHFFGSLPDVEYNSFRLPNSEIFAGSYFQWDGGSNNRIINFLKFNDIAQYKVIDNKEIYLKIKDSIPPMPTWPNQGCIKKVDNVIIVKLGQEKGNKLDVE